MQENQFRTSIDNKAMQPLVVAVGQAELPVFQFLRQQAQASPIVPEQLDQSGPTTSIARPVMLLRMSVTPQASQIRNPAGGAIIGDATRPAHGAAPPRPPPYPPAPLRRQREANSLAKTGSNSRTRASSGRGAGEHGA
jgi:hypothetical protein